MNGQNWDLTINFLKILRAVYGYQRMVAYPGLTRASSDPAPGVFHRTRRQDHRSLEASLQRRFNTDIFAGPRLFTHPIPSPLPLVSMLLSIFQYFHAIRRPSPPWLRQQATPLTPVCRIGQVHTQDNNRTIGQNNGKLFWRFWDLVEKDHTLQTGLHLVGKQAD